MPSFNSLSIVSFMSLSILRIAVLNSMPLVHHLDSFKSSFDCGVCVCVCVCVCVTFSYFLEYLKICFG